MAYHRALSGNLRVDERAAQFGLAAYDHPDGEWLVRPTQVADGIVAGLMWLSAEVQRASLAEACLALCQVQCPLAGLVAVAAGEVECHPPLAFLLRYDIEGEQEGSCLCRSLEYRAVGHVGREAAGSAFRRRHQLGHEA